MWPCVRSVNLTHQKLALAALQSEADTEHYCLTKISIRAKRSIFRVFSLFIVPSPFLYIARTKAVLTALPSVGHYVGPWAFYSPVQTCKPVSKKTNSPNTKQHQPNHAKLSSSLKASNDSVSSISPRATTMKVVLIPVG